MQWLKRFLIGQPLKSALLKHEKYNIFWGLSILSCDAISSVAYAAEAILRVLVPALGLLAFNYLMIIAGAIIVLLAILIPSYRQTIEKYPNGGGAYSVASDHLGTYAGVIAGVALLIDYILTVAVSIASGVLAITSAFPDLGGHKVFICLVILLILYIGNLRGVRESSRIFGLFAYIFIAAIASMVIVGVLKIYLFGYQPPIIIPPCVAQTCQPLGLLILLKAFSSGCTALTGIETVSNAVPNFQEPKITNAKRTLTLLAVTVALLFSGVVLLTRLYPVIPSTTENVSVLAQINLLIFGQGFAYYFIQCVTMIILAMAANAAYAGFPMLLSVMGRDGFVPRQFSKRGERLNYSSGITFLTIIAALLIVAFDASVTSLLGMYAMGVFTSFTLSQLGMFMYWVRSHEHDWQRKAFINGLGALITFITVLIIIQSKFTQGIWIILLVAPVIMIILLKIKRHYRSVYEQLQLSYDEIKEAKVAPGQSIHNHVIVPIASVNKASVIALRYAQSISQTVVAFHVVMEDENAKKIKEQWRLLKTEIPLVVKYSPYRKIVDPLTDFVRNYQEHSCQSGDMVTVILTQFSVSTWWHIFLHNQTSIWIIRGLLKQKQIAITTIPIPLLRDNQIDLNT